MIEQRALEPAEPVNPQLIFHELSKRLPDGAILTSDSGSAANWYARDVRLRAGMMATLSGTLATMGPGVPYAIAAKFAYPDRPVIALVGDGAMQMNGLAELITIAKYRERWSDQRLIVLVLNNRDLNQVTWEQRAMSGDPKFVESQELPDVPYARWAEMIGLNGIRTDDPEAIGECWDRALASERPTVLEVVLRPRGAAAAAAHHDRAGPLVRVGDPARRPRQPADHRPVAAPEAARVPARTMKRERLLGNLRRGRAQRTLAAATARARCRSAWRSTSSTSAAPSATSGCGPPSRSPRC